MIKKSKRTKSTSKSSKKYETQSEKTSERRRRKEESVKEEAPQMRIIKAVRGKFGIEYLVQEGNGKCVYLIKDQIVNDP